jgi:hypothetical protein
MVFIGISMEYLEHMEEYLLEYPWNKWNILTGAFYVGNAWEWGNGMIIDSYFFFEM